MSVNKIATRYSKSLFQLAKENEEVEAVRENVEELLSTWNDNKELVFILRSQVVKESDKWNIVKKIFENRFETLSLKFFELVIKKGRGRFLNAICEQFLNYYNEYKGIMEAKLTMAISPDKKITEKIKKLVEERYDKKVHLITEVDESIIGGFVLEFENYLYDASVKHQLKEVQKKLSIQNN